MPAEIEIVQGLNWNEMQEIKTAFEADGGRKLRTNEHLSPHNANTSIDFAFFFVDSPKHQREAQ